MKLTQEMINDINNNVSDSWNEGVFTEPTYIPVHIKEPVIYMRWTKSGFNGGNCWGDKAKWFKNNKPKFTVIDLVLKKLKPNITYLEYKEIEKLINSNSKTQYEYYGNSKDIEVEYIILSDLYKLLDSMN